jgi:hypothetical protein
MSVENLDDLHAAKMVQLEKVPSKEKTSVLKLEILSFRPIFLSFRAQRGTLVSPTPPLPPDTPRNSP